jgi:cell wall-associated NlpC family hydrolase
MIDIDAERAAVVAEARAWLRTPYHHMGRVKGAGVDCATLLAEIYARAGVVPAVAIPFYPPDWHLHRDAERYLGFVLEHDSCIWE